MPIHIPPTLYAKDLPLLRRQDELPPFWELEDLICAGLERETALAILALRREHRERGRSSSRPSKPCEPSAAVGADDLSDIDF